MKTTIDIPEKELQDAIEHTGAKTKREAIVTAVADFNRRKRLEALAGELGTFEQMMDLEELHKLRGGEVDG